ncbi:unnamed protein product [Xylocopa violacea]|uniref:Reverse transcriptase n=1 Tax=Xylocopa violacea TaxID=135666 RepID=A0ABP1MVZ3_XYLVO
MDRNRNKEASDAGGHVARPPVIVRGDKNDDIALIVEVPVPHSFRCPLCSMGNSNIGFLCLKDFRKHLEESHAGCQQQWVCGVCHASFSKCHAVLCHRPKCRGPPQPKVTLEHACDACGASFESKRGLSTHERKAHPDIRNEKRRDQATRRDVDHSAKLTVWTLDEIQALKEYLPLVEGCKQPNRELCKYIPGKTPKQIGEKRRQLFGSRSRTQILETNINDPDQAVVQESVQLFSEPGSPDQEQQQYPDEDDITTWKRMLTDSVIVSMDEQHDGGLAPARCCLRDICMKALEHPDQCQSNVDEFLDNCLVPSLWKPACPKKNMLATKKGSNRGRNIGMRAKRKQTLYARCQELYANSPRTLAEMIVNNEMSRVRPKAPLPDKSKTQLLYEQLWGTEGPCPPVKYKRSHKRLCETFPPITPAETNATEKQRTEESENEHEMDIDSADTGNIRSIKIRAETIQKKLVNHLTNPDNGIKQGTTRYILTKIGNLQSLLQESLLLNSRLEGQIEALKSETRKQRKDFVAAEKKAAIAVQAQPQKMTYAERLGIKSKAAELSNLKQDPPNVAVIRPADKTKFTNSEETKRALIDLVSPKENSLQVKNVRKVQGSAIIVETAKSGNVQTLIQSEKLKSAGLLVDIPVKKNPRIIVYGAPRTENDEDVIQAILDQNCSEQEKKKYAQQMKIAFKTGNKNNKDSCNIVLETSKEAREILIKKERLYIMWQCCRAQDYIAATRCYKCQAYGHTTKHCRKIARLMEQQNIDILLMQEPYNPGGKHIGLNSSSIIITGGKQNCAVQASIAIKRNRLTVLKVAHLSNEHCICIETTSELGRIYFVNMYFQYSHDIDSYLEQLQKILTNLKGEKVIIAADANAKSPLWHSNITDERGEKLEQLIARNNLIVSNEPGNPPTYSSPTGTSNIDVTLITYPAARLMETWTVQENWTSSDHNAIVYSLTKDIIKDSTATITKTPRFRTSKINWETFRNTLTTEKQEILNNWNNKLEEDIEGAAQTIHNCILNTCNKTLGHRKTRISAVPWWTEALTKLKRHTYRKRKTFQQTKDAEKRAKAKEEYHIIRNKYTTEIRKTKKECWEKFVTDEGNAKPWGTVYKICMQKITPERALATCESGTEHTITWKDTAKGFLQTLVPDDSDDTTELQRERRIDIQETPNTEDANSCEFPGCTRSFTTATGRGVHHRRAHQDWYDARTCTNVPAKKTRWNSEEEALLARKEAELVQSGVRFINQALHRAFPERSLESIKSHRKSASYKERVISILQSAPSAVHRCDSSSDITPTLENQSRHQDVNASSSDPIMEFLRQLPSGTSADFQQYELDNICRNVHLVPREETFEKLSLYLRAIFTRPNQKLAMSEKPASTTSRRKARRIEYAKIQDLWRKSRSRCVNEILSDIDHFTYPPEEIMTTFWTTIMCKPSNDSPGIMLPERTHDELWKPITSEEIERAYLRSGAAAGPDGVSPRLLRSVPKIVLLKILNLFLLVGKVPSFLLESRTSFIAKKANASEPGDFRPIAVSSVITRCFHKILANRRSKKLPFDDRQRGFRSADGCSENVFLLDMTLRYHHQRFKSLFLSSIDIAKAFDSISHRAIVDTLISAGVPTTFVNYVKYVYETGTTRFSCPGWMSPPIRPSRGVKQGDPLSPILFNLVIDRLFKLLPNEIGADIDGMRINAAAFADDILFMSSTQRGLQTLLDMATAFFSQTGLFINSGKSFTVALKSVPHMKKAVIDTTATFTVKGHELKALKRTDQWTYLGIPFTPEGRLSINPSAKLLKDLERLTRAPLKPQQRTFILRVYVIPGLYHLLSLGNINLGVLVKIDRVIRSVARKWLHLPKDTPNGYFHATIQDGGLGLPSFRWTAPLHRLSRLKKLPLSSQAASGASGFFLQEEIQKASRRLNDHGIAYDTKYKVNNRWAEILYRSVDGSALKHSRSIKTQHDWIGDGSRFLSGKDYVNSCRARINALPTRSRISRGRRLERQCRAGCLAPETLNHVVQQCHRSHAARIKRHNALTHYIERNLRTMGFQVDSEPHFNTQEGLRKPDIVGSLGNTAFVIDAQVVGEQACLRRSHDQKVLYYSQNSSLIREIMNKYNCTTVKTFSCTLTWRGIWSPQSVTGLLETGIIRKKDVKILSSRAVIGTLACFNTFCTSTCVTRTHSRTADITCRICQPPRNFNSARGLANHMRTHRSATPAAARPIESAGTASVTPPSVLIEQYACPDCQRSFTTRTGLGVHRKSQHPDLVNAEIVVDRARKGLSQEEMRMAATEEAYVIKYGHDRSGNAVRFINVFLAPCFPGRNSDGIKYARKTAAYRQLLDQALRALDCTTSGAPTSPSAGTTSLEGPTTSPADVALESDASSPNPRELYADAIRHLMQEVSGDDSLAGHPLIPLGEQLLGGHDVTLGVTEWIRAAAKPMARKRHSRKRRGREGGAGASRQKTRRREYARMQSLFKTNMSRAAKLVLDGDTEATTPSLEEMVEFWSPIFGHQSTHVEQHPPLPVHRQRFNLAEPITTTEVGSINVPNGSSPGIDGITPAVWRQCPVSSSEEGGEVQHSTGYRGGG